MTQENIKQQARNLEDRLWNIAEKLGLQNTPETHKSLGDIICGAVFSSPEFDRSKVIDKRFKEAIQARQSASENERLLAWGIAVARIAHEHADHTKGPWETLCEGYYYAGMLAESVGEKLDEEKLLSKFSSDRGKTAQRKKQEKDPKQTEKAFISKCWQDWQKLPDTYASKAAFARDMLTKCEYLKNSKKIEDWCREWEKAHPAG